MKKVCVCCAALLVFAMGAAFAQSNTDLAQAAFDRGNTALNQGNNDLAIREYTEAIRLLPNADGAYVYRGVAYFQKKEWDAAITDFSQAIRLDSNFAVAYYYRGVSYISRAIANRNSIDVNSADADADTLARLEPNNNQSAILKGLVNETKRESWYSAAAAPAPTTNNAELARAAYDRAGAFFGQGNMDAVIRELTEAIRLNPNFADAYYGRGLAYYEKRDWDRAIADYTQAIRINPNYAIAYHNRGSAYHNGKRDWDRAIADYTEAIRLNPNDANSYNNRGNSYQAKGEMTRANADFAKARELGYR